MRKLEHTPDGSQALFDTGCAAFDVYFTEGPLVGSSFSHAGQFSDWIRPYIKTNCGSETRGMGELQAHDLSRFRPPVYVKEAVVKATESEAAILYEFSHIAARRKVVHGFILTKTEGGCHEIIDTFVTGSTDESASVIHAMADYVSNPPGTLKRVVEQVIPEITCRLIETVSTETGEVGNLLVGAARFIVKHADLSCHSDVWHIWKAAIESRLPYGVQVHGTGMQAALEISCMLYASPEYAQETRDAMGRLFDLLPMETEFGSEVPKAILTAATLAIADCGHDLSFKFSR